MALLALLAVSFSVAPSWVKPGVSLNYTVASDLVSFTVLNRTASDVKIEVFTKSTSHKAYPTENATALYGQFWFDSASLASAYKGEDIGEYTVSDISSQSFAGQQWDTVSLQVTISGAITTKVLDKKTGLLLKQTVSAVGAPSVILQQFYVPDWVSAPPAPPVNNTPPINITGNVTTPQNNTVVTPSQNNTPPAQSNTTTIQNTTPPAPTTPQKKPLPCCPSAFILLVLGLAVVSRKE